MARGFTFSVVLAFVVVLITPAKGHGVMVGPATRGSCNSNSINRSKPRNLKIAAVYKAVRDPKCPRHDCPHCLNGGGKGAVIKAAKGSWRPFEPLNPRAPFRRDSAMCGDPAVGPQPHQKGGKYAYPSTPIMKTYKSGSKVKFVVDVTTNHNGFFEFFICDATKCGGDINEQCFKKGHCQQLKRVKNAECESQQSRECGPIDPKYPGRWYVPCRKGGHVGEHFMGGPYMEYQLPAGLSTDHAIIQWYWATANSCNPPGFKQYFERFPMKGWSKCPGDGGSFGGRNPGLATCGGKNFPEEFWNCADVAITSNGVTLPGQTRPKYSKPPRATERAPTPSRRRNRRSPTPTSTPKPSQKPRFNKNNQANNQKTSKQNKSKKKSLITRKGSSVGGSEGGECASNWTQCGGRFYKGPRCCNSGYQCVLVNDYYSQCKPDRRRR